MVRQKRERERADRNLNDLDRHQPSRPLNCGKLRGVGWKCVLLLLYTTAGTTQYFLSKFPWHLECELSTVATLGRAQTKNFGNFLSISLIITCVCYLH